MQLSSIDPVQTLAAYLSTRNLDQNAPNPATPESNCGGSTVNAITTSALSNGTALSQIPPVDAYGNSTRYGNTPNDAAYTNSHFVNGGGQPVPSHNVFNGTPPSFDATGATNTYNWGIAQWDAADNAGYRIRNDVNFPNRIGDTQRMKIQIFTIGYLGDGGLDDGLLKRIANDPSSTSYDSSQPQGMYIPAKNAAEVSQALATISVAILRLSR